MLKKFISIIIMLVMSFSLFVGCSPVENKKNLSIVTTIFPEYDWVTQILGDKTKNTDITMLLDSGVDLHSYQPSADDIIKINSCDIFIYVGGESDAWVEQTLKTVSNTNIIIINLMNVLADSIKEEETIEGMVSEPESDEEGPEYDEHIWLSLKNAEICVNAIKEAVIEVDSKNSNIYESNASNYCEKLNELDKEYENTINNANVKTILFADRFPFRYLVDDYGLSYYAAFKGCSAESEASFETIKFLANKIDELNLNVIFTLEGSDNKIAQTIISTCSNKNIQILSVNSMQSITTKDVNEGVSYLNIMKQNLKIFKEAII